MHVSQLVSTIKSLFLTTKPKTYSEGAIIPTRQLKKPVHRTETSSRLSSWLSLSEVPGAGTWEGWLRFQHAHRQGDKWRKGDTLQSQGPGKGQAYNQGRMNSPFLISHPLGS